MTDQMASGRGGRRGGGHTGKRLCRAHAQRDVRGSCLLVSVSHADQKSLLHSALLVKLVITRSLLNPQTQNLNLMIGHGIVFFFQYPR